jgi:putative transcriptional regulator
MRYRRVKVFLVLATFIGIGALGAAAQKAADKSLYLVARRELSDPFFKESVILMLPATDSDLVVGLIVNKPTRISLRDVFPENPALKDRTDTVFFGGPVEIHTPGVLFLSSKPIEQAVHLDGDLYISFDPDFIEETLVKPEEQVRDVRLFLGRAQWAPEQLQGEILRGSWYSEREENSWIFRRDPENVWSVLIGRLESGTPI